MVEPHVASDPAPRCYLCGGPGGVLYEDVVDRVSTAPGRWALRRCGACALVWLDPRPLPAEVPKLYARYYTHQSRARAPGALGARERLRDAIARRRLGYPAAPNPFARAAPWLAWIPPFAADADAWLMGLRRRPGGLLLDIGCGEGGFLGRMRELGWHVEGVEPDGVAARLARERHGVRVHEGSVESAAYPDGTFDAIVMSHVLEHLLDPVATLAECRRILAPGGVLSVLTPNADSFARRLFGRDWLHWDPPRHIFIFSARSLAESARRAGLEVRSSGTTARAARWAFGASWVIGRRGSFLDPSTARLTAPQKAGSAALALVEQGLLAVRAGLGEELFLRAGRPS